MFAINVRARIQSGKFDEAEQLLRHEIMPAAANYRGFVEAFLIVDAPNHRLATVSVWETEADAQAIYQVEGGLYQSALARLSALLLEPPDAWIGSAGKIQPVL